MRSRLISGLVALAFTTSCATTRPPPPEQEPARPLPPPPAALTPQASALFALITEEQGNSGVVIDLDAFEQLGFSFRGGAGDLPLAELAIPVLTFAGADDEDGEEAVRLAVALSVLQRWAHWPQVHRIGVVATSLPALLGSGQPKLSKVVLVLAVDQSAAQSRELIAGLLSLTRVLAQKDQLSGVVSRGADLCVEGDSLDEGFCLRTGEGYLMVGAPLALEAFGSPPPTAPRAAPSTPVMIHGRVDLGEAGRFQLLLTGRDAVKLSARVESNNPRFLQQLEQKVQQGLAEYDQSVLRNRTQVKAQLEHLQRALAKDPSAPASLKQSADQLTSEAIADPRGYLAQIRRSVQVARTEQALQLEATVPAPAVKEAADKLGGQASIATLGVLAAIAVPNFIKFQCRSKQAEAKALLQSAASAQRAFAAKKKRWGKSLAEIGFEPPSDTRYNYCYAGDCYGCTSEECKKVPIAESPCRTHSSAGKTLKAGFEICAYGDVDDDGDFDVWVIDQDRKLENPSNDCD